MLQKNLLKNKKLTKMKALQGDRLNPFNEVKQTLVNFTKFSYIHKDNSRLTYTTDRYSNSIGSVLHQEWNRLQKPITFFLSKSECTTKV